MAAAPVADLIWGTLLARAAAASCRLALLGPEALLLTANSQVLLAAWGAALAAANLFRATRAALLGLAAALAAAETIVAGRGLMVGPHTKAAPAARAAVFRLLMAALAAGGLATMAAAVPLVPARLFLRQPAGLALPFVAAAAAAETIVQPQWVIVTVGPVGPEVQHPAAAAAA
jgi:hypothetical protein